MFKMRDGAPPLGQEQWDKLLRLRGFLALYVVLHHVRNIHWPRLRELSDAASASFKGLVFGVNFLGQWGLYAVLAFFVISGFSIGAAYPTVLSSKKFWLARIRRLYPALIFSLVISGVLLALRAENFRGELVNFIATATFQNDITFGTSFAGNGPYWSLACEAWYYLFYPLILVRLNGVKFFAVALGLVVVPYVFYRQGAAQASVYAVIWLSGVFLARKANQKPNWNLSVVCLAVTIAGLLLHAFLDYKKVHLFPQADVSPAVVITGCAIAVCIYSFLHMEIAMGGRSLRNGLGEISYSLYLVHYPVLMFVAKLLPQRNDVWICIGASLLSLAASILLAIVSWRYFEVPYLKRHRRNIAAGA